MRTSSAVGGAVAALIIGSAVAQSCLDNTEVDCGSLHADTGRVCGTGNNRIPCGDIVLDSEPTCDVTNGDPGYWGTPSIGACTA